MPIERILAILLSMGRQKRTLAPVAAERMRRLGARLRSARRNRRMTETELAARTLTTRPTIRKLEMGDPSVSMAVLVETLQVLGLDADLDLIAKDDDLGRRLADARLPRPRRPASRGLADEL